ncbi:MULTISPECIES: hypothetical protein, partial [unclassified Acinetobacter]
AVAKALDCFVSHLVIISKLSQEVYCIAGSDIKINDIEELYLNLIDLINKKMKKNPKWKNGIELGKTLIEKKFSDIEHFFNPSEEIIKAYKAEKEKKKL